MIRLYSRQEEASGAARLARCDVGGGRGLVVGLIDVWEVFRFRGDVGRRVCVCVFMFCVCLLACLFCLREFYLRDQQLVTDPLSCFRSKRKERKESYRRRSHRVTAVFPALVLTSNSPKRRIVVFAVSTARCI